MTPNVTIHATPVAHAPGRFLDRLVIGQTTKCGITVNSAIRDGQHAAVKACADCMAAA